MAWLWWRGWVTEEGTHPRQPSHTPYSLEWQVIWHLVVDKAIILLTHCDLGWNRRKRRQLKQEVPFWAHSASWPHHRNAELSSLKEIKGKIHTASTARDRQQESLHSSPGLCLFYSPVSSTMESFNHVVKYTEEQTPRSCHSGSIIVNTWPSSTSRTLSCLEHS